MPTRGEAIEALTSVGAPFELETVSVHGNPLRVFKNAPSSLREVWLKAATRGETPYFTYDGTTISYGDANARVVSLAAWLWERGVRPGDRVAIGMRNFPEWAMAFWATQCIGAITVSLNAWWIAEELRYALEDSGAVAAIVDGERLDRLSDALLAEVGVRHVVVVRATARTGTTPWDVAAGNIDADLPDVDIAPEDDATILYTSGTTGFPKGAIGSHRNYITNLTNALMVVAVAQHVAGTGGAVASAPPAQVVSLTTFPYFHIAGLCGIITQTNNGANLVSMYKWDPAEALRLIERHRINTVGGVPTVVRTLLEHPDFDSHDLSSLTTISQGGSPVPPDTIARIEAHFGGKVSPGNGYGLTETTAAVIANSGATYFAKKDSVGLPYVGTRVRIVDENGIDVPVGATGEVWIYGPNNVRGYWNKPEATEKAFTDGWFHSGDAGYIDAEGFVYVVDRIKDMVLRGGENVYCVEVETVLFEHESVLDCAVIGLAHPTLGEEVVAVVVPEAGHGEPDTSALTAFLSTRLAPFKVPSTVIWREEALPRNATGKVLKKDLREQYSGN